MVRAGRIGRVGEWRMSHQRKVYLVDGDSDDRKAIAAHISMIGGEAWPLDSSRELLAVIDRLEPGCILLDCSGGLSALEAIEEIERRAPGWPVIGLGRPGDLALAVEAMKRGAADFLCKPLGALQLAAALTPAWAKLHRGADAHQARRFARERVGRLTAREFDVFLALVAGKANKAAAHQLGISVRTVEMHRARVMAKLAVRSLSEATLLMTQAGIDLSPALPFRRERVGDLRVPPAYRSSERWRAAAS